MKAVDVPPQRGNFGIADAGIIKPGQPWASTLYFRMAKFGRDASRVQRRLRLRTTDTPPDWREVLMHLAVWPIAAEVVGPHLFSHATGDILDVVAYIAGAVVATVLWSLA